MLPLKGLETSLADMDNNHGICAPGAACYFPRIAGIVPEALLIQPGAAWYTPCCLTSSKVTGVPWRMLIFMSLLGTLFRGPERDATTNKADTSPDSVEFPILWGRQP